MDEKVLLILKLIYFNILFCNSMITFRFFLILITRIMTTKSNTCLVSGVNGWNQN